MNETELFVDGLKSVLRIAKDSPVIVEARDGRLFIASHNDFHSIVYEYTTKWTDFKIVLSNVVAKQLPKQIKDDLELTVDENNNNVHLKSSGAKLKLNTLDPESLSLTRLLKQYTKTDGVKINGDLLKESIKLIKHSANDKTIGDQVLKGYHFTKEGDRIELMASNGATMSVTTVKVENADNMDDGVLLLNQEFDVVAELLLSKANLAHNGKALTIVTSDAERTIYMVSSLIQKEAFDYKTVLKAHKDQEGYYKLPKSDFIDASKRTLFFLDENDKNRIRLSFGDSKLILSTNNMYGKANTVVPVTETNLTDPVEFSIDGTNLSSYLSSTPSEEVLLRYDPTTTAILLEDGLFTELIVLFND